MNVSLQQKLVSDEKETRSRKTGKHAQIALFPPVARAEEIPPLLENSSGSYQIRVAAVGP
jgi:hypothetical protein